MILLKRLFHAENVNRIILLLLLVIVSHLEIEYFKSRNVPKDTPVVPFFNQPETRVEVKPDPAQAEAITEIKGELAKAKEALARQRDMITLIAAMNNENFTALKNNDPDYLMIQSDWSINRYPKYIDLNNDTREWFRRFVVTGGNITDSSTKTPMPAPEKWEW